LPYGSKLEFSMPIIAPQPGKPVKPDQRSKELQKPTTPDKDLPKAQRTPSDFGGGASSEGGAHG